MQTIIGIDEVGRGPLAGPVSVGLAVVPVTFDFSVFPGLTDSKKMTEKARERVYALACELKKTEMLRFGVFSVAAKHIDAEGIEFCIRSAIARGLKELTPDPGGVKIFLDGRLKAPEEYEQETIIRGDLSTPVISLASVVAKVTRDRHMTRTVDAKFPEYGFAGHKGYGTAAHIAAIKKYGPSVEHRTSFLRNLLPQEELARTMAS